MSGGHIEKPPKIPSQGIRHDIILNYSTRCIMLKSATTQWHQWFNQYKFSPHLCANVECSTMKEHNRKVFQRRKKTIVQLLVFAQRDTDLGEIPPHPPPPLTSPLHNTIIQLCTEHCTHTLNNYLIIVKTNWVCCVCYQECSCTVHVYITYKG